jgi:hypothetical protein
MICATLATGAFAQKPHAVIKQAGDELPAIDGIVEQLWDTIPAQAIDRPFGTEVPSLGNPGETTWQAIWNYSGIWVLLQVTDDYFYPHYAVDPPGNTWEYDKPELYFDVNYILVNDDDNEGPLPDGRGNGNGHYQICPAFTDGMNDGTMITINDGITDGVQYAFFVSDPSYVAEYFIPLSVLLDDQGATVDLTGEVGFDVTIIDRDPGDAAYNSAVWSNIGTNESSWNGMDDCGIITFENAQPLVWIEDLSLTGGEITENNGTLQIQVSITPENATVQKLKWEVVNGSGRAKVNSNGLVTAIMDGEVTVIGTTTDGSWIEESATVTISNQIVSIGEINVIRNPNFDRENADGTAAEYGGWGGDAGAPLPQVVDGVAVCTPAPDGAEAWQYSLNQSALTALPDIPYVFSFVAWADEARTFMVDFENIYNELYNYYGASTDPRSPDGLSDWTFDITDQCTRYTFDVVFDAMDENTIQTLVFQLGLSDIVTYIDSLELVSEADYALITQYTPVTAIVVTGAGGATSVPVDGTLQMSAEVFPAEADYPGVKWSVVNGTGTATIDENGLLTPETSGKVTVVASAVDDSGVTDELQVTVTWPMGIAPSSVDILKIFPNPATDEIHIVLDRADRLVTVYNSVGMKMDEVLVNGTEQTLDISSYSPGLYFVRTEHAVSKFIK